MKLPYLPLVRPSDVLSGARFRFADQQWESLIRKIQERVKASKPLDYNGKPFSLEVTGAWDEKWSIEVLDWLQSRGVVAPGIGVVRIINEIAWGTGLDCRAYRALGFDPDELVLIRGIHPGFDEWLNELERRIAAGVDSLRCPKPVGSGVKLAPVGLTIAAIIGVEWMREWIRRRR